MPQIIMSTATKNRNRITDIVLVTGVRERDERNETHSIGVGVGRTLAERTSKVGIVDTGST